MQKIRTELEIAYFDGNQVETLSYLDLDRRSEIFGIKVGSQIVSITEDGVANWHLAKMIAMKAPMIKGKSAQLPSIGSFDELYSLRYEFNRTIYDLRKWRVSANYWQNAVYHAFEVSSNEYHFAYDMKTGKKLKESNGYEQVNVRLVYPV